jgi:putative transposase
VGRVDVERRRSTVDRLLALRTAGGLTSEHVRLAAGGVGVSERTVWRWIDAVPDEAEPGPRPLVGYELSDTDREAFACFRGNVAAVARARAAVVTGADGVAGAPVPEFLVAGWTGARPVVLRTLQRAFAGQLTPAERAAWSEGEEGRRAAGVYLTRPASGRNQVWELDHTNLPIVVLPPRGPAVRPWLTTVIDDSTRALVGWAIALTPHAGTVLTALRMALVPDEQRGPFGAVPAAVRVDRGLDFAATAVADVMAALCVRVDRLPGFTPHRKGKVERIHRTIDQTLLCTLPGFTEGPRDAAGRLYGAVSDSAKDRAAAPARSAAPLRLELFAARFGAWVSWYNGERPHAGLGGRTPLEAWTEDPSALHRIAEDRLRHLLLAGVDRRIGKDGVRLHGLAYVAPELQGRRGQQVQVRFMPHDDRSVEVYLDGAHLCTAFPQGQLSPDQVVEFRDHARDQSRQLSAQRRRATARGRAELVPLTSEQSTAVESTLVSVSAGGGPFRGDGLLRRRARTNLLGLTDPTVPADTTARPATTVRPATSLDGAR